MHKGLNSQVIDFPSVVPKLDVITEAVIFQSNAGNHAHNEVDAADVARPQVIDLFAGVGGLSLGAARAGFDIALAVEKDKHAYAAHKLNFPNSKHSDSDISTMSGADLLKLAGLEVGDLDGLIGGPPCQGFSSIGHRNIEDARNGLFAKFFALVNETQPKFFVAENVLGILDPQYEDIRKQAIAQVGSNYTILQPIRFKASDYGAPTVRERVFFIGYKEKYIDAIGLDDFTAKKIKKPVCVSDALKGLPSIRSSWLEEHQGMRKISKLPNGDYFHKIAGCIPKGVGDKLSIERYVKKKIISGCLGTMHSAKVEARYGNLKPGQSDSVSRSVRLDKNGFCPTLRAGTGPERGSYQAVRPIHPSSPRVITPREAARLQGFPDWYQFAPSKWHSFRQIGNSVCPLVAEIVLSVLKGKL